MGETSIEWTDKTWNPVTGCTKVSPGCKYCYAERVFPRAYSRECLCGHRIAIHDHTFESNPCLAPKCFCSEFRARQFTDVRTHADRLDQPIHWRKPARIFVNSMSDLFHEDVPFEFIDKVFAVMALTPRHTYQVLTKRPERMLEYCLGLRAIADLIAAESRRMGASHVQGGAIYETLDGNGCLDNVWLGVSVENQQYADERIPLLLQTPAAVRFVSYEPALTAVRFFTPWLTEKLPRLDWIIVGGESGPSARPFNIQWARDVIEQCRAAGVACFVKQLGARVTFNDGGGRVSEGLRDRKGGDWTEWPEDLRVREFPQSGGPASFAGRPQTESFQP